MVWNKNKLKIERGFWMKNNGGQFHPYFYLHSREQTLECCLHVSAHMCGLKQTFSSRERKHYFAFERYALNSQTPQFRWQRLKEEVDGNVCIMWWCNIMFYLYVYKKLKIIQQVNILVLKMQTCWFHSRCVCVCVVMDAKTMSLYD